MNKWEEFAQENAEYYILTHKHVDYSNKEGQDYFFKTGEQDAKVMLQNVSPFLTRKGCALEIGCGIGRLSFAHAKVFQEVIAVDISETMLKKLRILASNKNILNIKTFLAQEDWDKEKYYDYIYSFIVFQHIAEFSIIENYIKRIAKSITPDGVIQLHFDTRKASILYQLRNLIPDRFLPRSQRIGIRRNRRSSNMLKRMFHKYGLKVMKELHPDSPAHLFILGPM